MLPHTFDKLPPGESSHSQTGGSFVPPQVDVNLNHGNSLSMNLLTPSQTTPIMNSVNIGPNSPLGLIPDASSLLSPLLNQHGLFPPQAFNATSPLNLQESPSMLNRVQKENNQQVWMEEGNRNISPSPSEPQGEITASSVPKPKTQNKSVKKRKHSNSSSGGEVKKLKPLLTTGQTNVKKKASKKPILTPKSLNILREKKKKNEEVYSTLKKRIFEILKSPKFQKSEKLATCIRIICKQANFANAPKAGDPPIEIDISRLKAKTLKSLNYHLQLGCNIWEKTTPESEKGKKGSKKVPNINKIQKQSSEDSQIKSSAKTPNKGKKSKGKESVTKSSAKTPNKGKKSEKKSSNVPKSGKSGGKTETASSKKAKGNKGKISEDQTPKKETGKSKPKDKSEKIKGSMKVNTKPKKGASKASPKIGSPLQATPKYAGDSLVYCICQTAASETRMIECTAELKDQRCNGWVHLTCVGLNDLSEEELEKLDSYSCPMCKYEMEGKQIDLMVSEDQAPKKKICKLCHSNKHTGLGLGTFIGPFLDRETKQGHWVHEYCCLGSTNAGLTEEGGYYNAGKTCSDSANKKCTLGEECLQSKPEGASLRCTNRICNTLIHVACCPDLAKKLGKFPVLKSSNAAVQKIAKEALNEAKERAVMELKSGWICMYCTKKRRKNKRRR